MGNQRTRCTYADKYRATRAPRCGCTACAEKWAAGQNAPRYATRVRKLTDADVRRIRMMRTVRAYEVALAFGVSEPHIQAIWRGDKKSHVPDTGVITPRPVPLTHR